MSKKTDIEELQWLHKTILTSGFRDRLIELGDENYVKWIEKEAMKSVEQYRRSL